MNRAKGTPEGMEHEVFLIEGVQAMARLCKKGRSTIYVWIHKHGFPAGKLPSGKWATTKGLIEQWILARGIVDIESTNIRPDESTGTD